MREVYELAPVIADVIAAHCPGTTAREHFVRACLGGHWYEAKSMIEGMLAEQLERSYAIGASAAFLEETPVVPVLYAPSGAPFTLIQSVDSAQI